MGFDGTEFAAIAVAHALAVASPGPDFVLVLRQSLTRGRAAAMAGAWGIAAGILVHVAYSQLGVALIVRNSPGVFSALKYAGAVYLVWLGWHAIRSRPSSSAPSAPSLPAGVPADVPTAIPASIRAEAWRGFLTNLLNPKATLFFLALFSVVVDPATPRIVLVGYGLWMAVTTGIWFSLVATVFTRAAVRRGYARFGPWIDRVMGAVFWVFALQLVLSERG